MPNALRVSKDAGKLAAAVGVLLEATTWGPEITLELVWDAIETVVSRADGSLVTLAGFDDQGQHSNTWQT